ncbi:MAG: hypothetical protein AB7S53_01810 [Thiomonas sp.]|jgi:hypothetical protein|nr:MULTISPECIES: hypothetical protein [Thiomonas]MDE1980664.1 hypothetical protein [Betaproteobacteria bacterium]MBN8744998.1 hypothetical protein [Thiomonas arsenitoxydans]MBN8776661.1 hypothetical protein [Thiomonas arsenitoxydans]MDE2268728.1 hypothetical protein [Betaproteobacteria bacterium]HML81380.1 hypothetical protein [Thiomonas arsenitoxydans]
MKILEEIVREERQQCAKPAVCTDAPGRLMVDNVIFEGLKRILGLIKISRSKSRQFLKSRSDYVARCHRTQPPNRTRRGT